MKNIRTKFILFIILIISIGRYYSLQGIFFSKLNLSITVGTALFVFILFIFFKKLPKQKNSTINIGLLFCLGFWVVHFMDYLAFIVGDIETLQKRRFSFSNYIVNEASILALCSLITFFMGYIQCLKPFPSNKNQYNINFSGVTKFFDLVLYVSLLWFYFSTDKSYFHNGSSDLMNSSSGLSFSTQISQVLFQAAFIAQCVFVIFLKNIKSLIGYIKSFSINFYIAILTFCFLVLISGDRGPLYFIGLGYLSTYYLATHKILNYKKGFIFLLVGIFCLSFLAFVRDLDGDINMSKINRAQDNMQENYSGKNIVFTSTVELSNVNGTYLLIYDYLSRTGDFAYGMNFLDKLLGFIPGLRPMIVYPILGEFKNLSANTLTGVFDVGLGTTCVAETYKDFGFIGTLVFYFFFGLLIKKFDLTLYDKRPNIVMLTLAMSFLCNSVYLGRSTLTYPINTGVYALFLIFLCRKIVKSKI